MDDERLLERMRQGDDSAFAELFARHRAVVYRYAVHMAGHGAADDIVQEAFLALIRQSSRFDPARGTVQAYLLGIARKHLLKRFEMARISEPIDEESSRLETSAPNPFEDLSRAEIVDRVRAAIVTLPLVFREAIVLCDLNETDYETAAAVMDCPVGTVRSRLHRARALLVSKLNDLRQGHEPPTRQAMVGNGRYRH